MKIDNHVVISALRELGVGSGDMIGLHSNVPSLGRVLIDIRKQDGEGGLNQAVHDLIDAFAEAVGPSEGLVMVPTFSYCYVGSKNGPYHPAKSRSRTGMLTQLFIEHEGSRRSLQPTHSVATIGGRSAEIVKDHEKKTPLGEDSPFHRLAKGDGWICYLGTNSKTLSLLHVAEAVGQVPYVDTFCYEHIGWKRAAVIEKEDGSVEEVPLREIPGCSEGFGKFDELAESAGIRRKGSVYGSKVVLFRAKEALELLLAQLKKDPFWLICEEGKCKACDVRWKACK